MKRVIALLDDSGYTQSVCDHAAWVASRAKGSLVYCHVLGRRVAATESSDFSGSIGLGARTSLLKELAGLDGQKSKLFIKRGREILEEAKQRAAGMGVDNVSVSLRNGHLVETAGELEQKADVIVLGKRGATSHLDMDHLGSNLERVVRSCKKPVMVTSRAFSPIEKLLIAFDGGNSSVKAVEHIARSEVFHGLECLLINVSGDNAGQSDSLSRAVGTLTDAGYQVQSSVVAGQPETVIAETVEQQGFDMLVMGAYGHSRIRNLIIGSTTTQMIRACKVPIALFR